MARTGPVQPRDGFTGIPNAILARVLADLTPEQLRLFLGLVYSAEFKRGGSTTPDGWRVGFGQALVGYDSAATAYGMSRDAVRRALRRFQGVAVATLLDAPSATPATTRAATSPKLVDFGTWFGIQASAEVAATPPATPHATPAATPTTPIQHGNTGTTNTERQQRSLSRAGARTSRPQPSEWRTVVDVVAKKLPGPVAEALAAASVELRQDGCLVITPVDFSAEVRLLMHLEAFRPLVAATLPDVRDTIVMKPVPRAA